MKNGMFPAVKVLTMELYALMPCIHSTNWEFGFRVHEQIGASLHRKGEFIIDVGICH